MTTENSKEKLLDAMLAEDARLPNNAPDQDFLDEITSKLDPPKNIIKPPFWKRPELQASMAACLICSLIITGAGLWKTPLAEKAEQGVIAGPYQAIVNEGSRLKNKAELTEKSIVMSNIISPAPSASPVRSEDLSDAPSILGADLLSLDDEVATLSVPDAAPQVKEDKLQKKRKALGANVEIQGATRIESRESPICKKPVSFGYPKAEPNKVQKQNLGRHNQLIDQHFKSPAESPLSTFSVDTDRASYTNLRNNINHGIQMNPDSVRIEEMINAFSYDYPKPSGDHLFSVNVETAGCPWNTETRLVKIGLKGKELAGTLITIAKDVKIQVEFNPEQVAEYRLIGYANRQLKDEDFNNDRVDAGEIGAGHTVTALYEIIPGKAKPGIDELRYGNPQAKKKGAPEDKGLRAFTNDPPELLNVKVRYKKPEGTQSILLEQPVRESGKEFQSASDDFRFASSVALYGMLLRGSESIGADYSNVEEIAKGALKGDENRKEFLELVKKTVR